MTATAESTQRTDGKPTIVLVHGAFADASSWNAVIDRLQHQGYTVVAAANPLRGVAADSAYLASVVNQLDGPVLLVGHSYAAHSSPTPPPMPPTWSASSTWPRSRRTATSGSATSRPAPPTASS